MNQASTTAQAGGKPVALVTGGLQGLGLATVQQLSADGFAVAVCDLAAETGHLPQALQGLADCRYYCLDISMVEAHEATVARIVQDFGRLDCLVNNAGIAARPLTDLLDLAPAAFDRSVDVNLRGTFFLSQCVARAMLAHPSSDAAYRSMIFITSIAAGMVSTQRAQYCTTKAALAMVSQLFAVRLAPHDIHVHEVRPGFMQTAMTASLGRTAVDEWIESGRVPLARWGQAADLGQTVSSLARGQMPYATGGTVFVAGGLNVAQAT